MTSQIFKSHGSENDRLCEVTLSRERNSEWRFVLRNSALLFLMETKEEVKLTSCRPISSRRHTQLLWLILLMMQLVVLLLILGYFHWGTFMFQPLNIKSYKPNVKHLVWTLSDVIRSETSLQLSFTLLFLQDWTVVTGIHQTCTCKELASVFSLC